jgi:septal ring factor EnvC (AmiA/AmiB activator)
MADPIADQWLARFQAAQPAEHGLRLTNLEAQTTVSTAVLAVLVQKIATLEERMSQTDDAITELNTATNDLAARIDVILSNEASLDANTATELRAVRDRLQGLAADPANPVPPVDGGTDVPA